MNSTAKAILATSAMLGTLALAATQASAGPVAQPAASEKCYGVAASGKNDCAAGAHSCAGQSTKNFDKASFVYLPNGACSKLAGGSMMAGK
ncbi:MAG TPA: DUF2282 domain-containing protein [Rhizomicrobium sp.]|jgi:uncharacterized membrane protein|nr:DUF2282 domain-containing protein [Rhizomicrobium sp.]